MGIGRKNFETHDGESLFCLKQTSVEIQASKSTLARAQKDVKSRVEKAYVILKNTYLFTNGILVEILIFLLNIII